MAPGESGRATTEETVFTSVVNEYQVNRRTNRVSVSKTGTRLLAKNYEIWLIQSSSSYDCQLIKINSITLDLFDNKFVHVIEVTSHQLTA
jgi:hypothetical protein